MSIFRRGKIWYASISIPGKKRVKESLGTTDKRQAQELHDKLKSQLWRVDRLGEMPDFTFEEAALRWLEERSDKKSLDTDKSLIGFWLQHFEGVNLKYIDEAKIYKAVNKMTNRRHYENWKISAASAEKKGEKPSPFKPKAASVSTKAAHLTLLKSIMRAAEREWKWIDKAPLIKVPQPKNRRVRWLEPHEARRLIEECHEPLKSVVTFALATGLRRSNIINLEWQQIDMPRKVAWINPEDSKSGRAIGVALNETAIRVLLSQIGRHNKYVFVHTNAATRPDGSKTPKVRKMRVDDNSAWNSSLKRAGIDNFRFHDLRHTWASWLVQSGVPLSILQEMGGWESIDMVRRYAHLAPNHLTEHACQIDSIMGDDVSNLSHQTKKALRI